MFFLNFHPSISLNMTLNEDSVRLIQFIWHLVWLWFWFLNHNMDPFQALLKCMLLTGNKSHSSHKGAHPGCHALALLEGMQPLGIEDTHWLGWSVGQELGQERGDDNRPPPASIQHLIRWCHGAEITAALWDLLQLWQSRGSWEEHNNKQWRNNVNNTRRLCGAEEGSLPQDAHLHRALMLWRLLQHLAWPDRQVTCVRSWTKTDCS